jgi:hypothetical protein
MIRSTKDEDGKLLSNIRWSYGHVTIPRHLRDIVITEYGIADLRGRTDEEVIAALVKIADSRFQDALVSEAKRAGKLDQDYRIPDQALNNRPERLKVLLGKYRERGLFRSFPFGTDLTDEELVLQKALFRLKQIAQRKKLRLPRLAEIRKIVVTPANAGPFLERMTLDRPHSLKEKLLKKMLVYALASVDAI